MKEGLLKLGLGLLGILLYVGPLLAALSAQRGTSLAQPSFPDRSSEPRLPAETREQCVVDLTGPSATVVRAGNHVT